MYCLIFEALEHEVQVEHLRSPTEEPKDIPVLRWEGRENVSL